MIGEPVKLYKRPKRASEIIRTGLTVFVKWVSNHCVQWTPARIEPVSTYIESERANLVVQISWANLSLIYNILKSSSI